MCNLLTRSAIQGLYPNIVHPLFLNRISQAFAIWDETYVILDSRIGIDETWRRLSTVLRVQQHQLAIGCLICSITYFRLNCQLLPIRRKGKGPHCKSVGYQTSWHHLGLAALDGDAHDITFP